MINIPTGLSLYTHFQAVASDTWTISHPLNSTALAIDVIIDYEGTVQTAIPHDIIFEDASTITVKWISAHTGQARIG